VQSYVPPQSFLAVPYKEMIMKTHLVLVAMAFGILARSVLAHAQLVEKTALTLDGAKKIVAVAEAKAKAEGARVVIAVVDEGGSLLLLERLDDTQVASVNVGIDKARTAAIYRRPSKVFEDQVKNGRVSALTLHGAVALQGGVPIHSRWKSHRCRRCQWRDAQPR
jgi:glc operon protein GlcG